jgi:hypothetical protein
MTDPGHTAETVGQQGGDFFLEVRVKALFIVQPAGKDGGRKD